MAAMLTADAKSAYKRRQQLFAEAFRNAENCRTLAWMRVEKVADTPGRKDVVQEAMAACQDAVRCWEGIMALVQRLAR